MNSENANFEPSEEIVKIGETLKRARESASFSIEHVVSHTHLSTDVIQALEEERFDQLPGEVFVRGYLRTYSKLLEIDGQPLIDAYDRIKPAEIKPARTSIKKKRRSIGVDPVVIWSTVAVATILIGLVMTWWSHQETAVPVQLTKAAEQFDDSVPLEESDNTPVIESTHQVGLGELSPEIDSSLQSPGEAAVAIDEPEEPPLVEPEPQAATIAIEAPLSGGNVDKVRIIVRYKEESWTEIFDARKRRLLHGLIQPGAVRIISGQAPLNVFLGNSPGVELEINGKPFDHSPYIRRNNTARFLIDDSNT